MKRLFCLILVFSLSLSLTACGKDNSPAKAAKHGNQIGDLCYGITLTEIDQNGYTDRTFDPAALGKITVINFWAYWCSPCVNELPHFDAVAREMPDDVAVVAIHCDELEAAKPFIEDNYPDSPIRFAMSPSGGESAYYSLLGGNGSIPYTVVLDADGIIRKTFVGAITYDTLSAAIQDCRG